MENLLWIFLIAGMFYWMFRKGGCCGGGAHGGHSSDATDRDEGTEESRPVKARGSARGGCH